MKKTFLLSYVFAALVVFPTISCDDTESIDPTLIDYQNQNGGNNGNGNNGGNGSNTGEDITIIGETIDRDGDYFPTAINNTWNYIEIPGNTNKTIKVIGRTTVNNRDRYTLDASMVSVNIGDDNMLGTTEQSQSIYKNNGSYVIDVDALSVENSIEGMIINIRVSPYSMVLLQDNLPVNGAWTGAYTQLFEYSHSMPEFPQIPTVRTNVTYRGTILERGATVTVGSTTYENVIKTKFVQNSTSNGQTTSTETIYYFAKDIGIIKMENTDASSYVSVLTSYSLN